MQISAGEKHTAYLRDGALYIWGSGKFGRLGLGDNLDYNAPRRIPFFADKFVTEVSCGCNHTMALTASGELYAWGPGCNGQLGTGDSLQRDTPTLVEIANVVKIHCGNFYSLMQTRDDKLFVTGLAMNTSKFRDEKILRVPTLISSLHELWFQGVHRSFSRENDRWTRQHNRLEFKNRDVLAGKMLQEKAVVETSLEEKAQPDKLIRTVETNWNSGSAVVNGTLYHFGIRRSNVSNLERILNNTIALYNVISHICLMDEYVIVVTGNRTIRICSARAQKKIQLAADQKIIELKSGGKYLHILCESGELFSLGVAEISPIRLVTFDVASEE